MPSDPDIEFPGNIVKVIRDHVVAEGYSTQTLGRPLRPTDPNGIVGVSARDWAPLEEQIGQWDPAISRYMLQVESMARHTSEEEAVRTHNLLAKKLRVMLYRDLALRAALSQLSEASLGLVERFQKVKVESQRFASNDVGNEFIFYAVLNVAVETEIV